MFATCSRMRYLRAMVVDYSISESVVNFAVKPETDPRFLRERALFVIEVRRALGLPVRVNDIRDQIPHLVVQGGKGRPTLQMTRRPTAA